MSAATTEKSKEGEAAPTTTTGGSVGATTGGAAAGGGGGGGSENSGITITSNGESAASPSTRTSTVSANDISVINSLCTAAWTGDTKPLTLEAYVLCCAVLCCAVLLRPCEA